MKQEAKCNPFETLIMRFFMSTQASSTQRHLYVYNLESKSKRRLTPPDGMSFSKIQMDVEDAIVQKEEKVSGYYEVSFSPGCSYYLLNYKGPHIPWQKVVSSKRGRVSPMLSCDRIYKVVEQESRTGRQNDPNGVPQSEVSYCQ